jgi:hypothetical protein
LARAVCWFSMGKVTLLRLKACYGVSKHWHGGLCHAVTLNAVRARVGATSLAIV